MEINFIVSDPKVKEDIERILEECTNNINEGNVDTFRSYEEGVKDTIEWLFYGSDKPCIEED